jgi:hypothetical protein
VKRQGLVTFLVVLFNPGKEDRAIHAVHLFRDGDGVLCTGERDRQRETVAHSLSRYDGSSRVPRAGLPDLAGNLRGADDLRAPESAVPGIRTGDATCGLPIRNAGPHILAVLTIESLQMLCFRGPNYPFTCRASETMGEKVLCSTVIDQSSDSLLKKKCFTFLRISLTLMIIFFLFLSTP